MPHVLHVWIAASTLLTVVLFLPTAYSHHWLTSLAAAAQDNHTLLLLSFERTLTGADGESPAQASGVTFEAGIQGNGVLIDGSDVLTYSTSGNFTPAEGTIEFWIRPRWDGNDGIGHAFFSIGNDLLIVKDGANNLRFIMRADDSEAFQAFDLGNWVAGEWHYLAFTWTIPGEMRTYVDGVETISHSSSAQDLISSVPPTLSIGSLNNSLQADAVIDELRISDLARSPEEIQAAYNAGLGTPLFGPLGLDTDSAGRTIVAESANRITVFDAGGNKLFRFGSMGTGNGEFKTPADVAIDDSDNIYVVDADNNRVQKFDSAGMFLSQFGTSGTGAGQFNRPLGIYVDRAADKIYVADTGNQRVQRFNQNGTIDTGWGSGGIVGTTGVVRRDHTGFDGPMNVAVHPINGNVYVADHGNQRLEVYNSNGNYVRTFLAVYRPNSLAFDSAGNLYIAGEDPNDSYTAFDGKIRLLRAGDELISRHYTGGIDDIGRFERGVALRNDGSIVFSDTRNGRLVKTDPAFTRPISDLAIDARGTSVTFRWQTAQGGPSSVRYSSTPKLSSEVNDPTVTTQHEVTVNNLTPNTRLFYSVSFPDSFDGIQRGTPADILNTGAVAGSTQFLRLKAVGLIYLDTNPGSGFVPMNNEQLTAARNRFETISRFYWINSGFKLWLDYTIVEIDRDLVGDCFNVGGAAEADLAARGFSATNDFDAVHATSFLFCGNFGGQGTLFGRFIGQSEWVSQDDFSAIHEVNHSIDSIYNLNGLTKYEFNHGIWAIPNALGRDFAVNAQIVRNMLPVNFTATEAPFNKIMTAPDNDNDGVPDSSPSGLTNAFSITEDTLKSSNSSTDSDGDGLSDLLEATALPFHSTDLNVQDTDGDGIRDGADLNPAYRVANCIIKGTPVIDGTINSREGWTILTDHWGYINDALVPDSNALQENVTTYAAWDENFLYLALKGPPAATSIHLDGNADNWFMNPDNYHLIVRNDFSSIAVNINVGVPDIFRQIDNDGQFSEFFDTDPQFTKPYQGRPILTDPGDGLGFPGRLVSEADLRYARGGSGDDSVWEVAIPRSNATLLKGFAGKKMAIEIDVGGDKLFESDHAVRFTLIEDDNTPPTIACPADIIVNSDPGVPNATVNLVMPTVSDNCSVSISGVRSDGKPLTDPFAVGTTTITWTATDVGGNTSSCSSTVTVNPSASAQSILQSVLAKLAELSGETTSRSDQLKLRQASEALSAALTIFTDPNHLDIASGEEAFDDLRYAVKKLSDLLEDDASEVPDEEVREALVQILGAARLLAVTAIDDAVSRGGNPRFIDKANVEISAGDKDASVGSYYLAATHYRDAWKYAVSA